MNLALSGAPRAASSYTALAVSVPAAARRSHPRRTILCLQEEPSRIFSDSWIFLRAAAAYTSMNLARAPLPRSVSPKRPSTLGSVCSFTWNYSGQIDYIPYSTPSYCLSRNSSLPGTSSLKLQERTFSLHLSSKIEFQTDRTGISSPMASVSHRLPFLQGCQRCMFKDKRFDDEV